MLTAHVRITALVYLSTIVLSIAFFALYVLNTGGDETETQRTKVTVLTILAVGAVVWPLLWYVSIGSVVMTDGAVLPLFGALWPAVMLLLDIRGVGRSQQRVTNLTGSLLQEDANSLVGIAFAFAMLMVATYAKKQKEMYSAMMMVLFALVLCIAFVIPQPASGENKNYAYIWSAAQRVVFAFAMGYILTALCITIATGSKLLAES